MKNLIITLAMLLLFAVGCTDQTSITSPEQSVQTQEPNWIALPQAEGMSLGKISSSSKSVNGTNGTTWPWNTSYSGSNGRITINTVLVVESNSFSGTVTIKQSHDDAYCVTTFTPSMVFNKPLLFTITYTGIDLAAINPADVKFAYIAADGSVQYAENDGIVVDLATGKLGVINARIPHFSRYGFVN